MNFSPDFASIHCSFGWENERRDNFAFLDENTLLTATGNLVILIDLRNQTQKYIQSVSGIGISAIAVHPARKYFAVAHKGASPEIVIYRYPEFASGPHKILKGGTTRSYASIQFSHDGSRLASVGTSPDFMLTVWNWDAEASLLRYKAFSQEVFKVYFSPRQEGRLITSGTGHIKFWKMAQTFTGLKLQGELGKFGKAELSDISGFVELPDGKVLSGTERGTLILWDGNFIKREMSKRNQVPCHEGTIEVVLFEDSKSTGVTSASNTNGPNVNPSVQSLLGGTAVTGNVGTTTHNQIVTAGHDGYVRLWDFDSLDATVMADIGDDSKFLEIDPIREIKIGDNVKIKGMLKGKDYWIVYDAIGGLWKLNMANGEAQNLASFHAGKIMGLDASPNRHLAATTGADGTVRVYNYVAKKPLAVSKFSAGGSCLRWAPQTVDEYGVTFAAGFEDGVVRILAYKASGNDKGLKLLRVFKPHKVRINDVQYSPKGDLLVTCSEDNTLFFVNVANDYSPIGFAPLGSAPVSLSWASTSSNMIVCCRGGQVYEIGTPSTKGFDTSESFEIKDLNVRETVYHLPSEEVAAKQEKEEPKKLATPSGPILEASQSNDLLDPELLKAVENNKNKPKKVMRKVDSEDSLGSPREEEQQVVEAEPAPKQEEAAPQPETTETAPQLEEEAAKEEEEEKEAAAPGKPLCILYKLESQLHTGDKFYITYDGRDSSFIYVCRISSDKPEQEIVSHKVATRVMQYSQGANYLLCGTDDGTIFVRRREQLDQFFSWNLHDGNYGHITRICTSFDESYLMSVGHDGNFFVYKLENPEQPEYEGEAVIKLPIYIQDIVNSRHYSLQEEKIKIEQDRILELAEDRKETVRQQLNKLREDFTAFLRRNKKIPPEEQLSRDEFLVDPLLRQTIQQETEKKKESVLAELAWTSEFKEVQLEKLKKKYFADVAVERIVIHAFKTPHKVSTFPLKYLSKKAQKKIADVHAAIRAEQEAMLKSQKEREAKVAASLKKQDNNSSGDKNTVDDNLTTLKSRSAISKLEERKKRRQQRDIEWSEFSETKPDDKDDPVDLEKIRKAEKNMGDYPLKRSASYRVPENMRINTEKKRRQRVLLIESIYNIKAKFNAKILAVRDVKEKSVAWIQKVNQRLAEINKILNVDEPLFQPTLLPDEKPENRFVYTKDDLVKFQREQARLAKRAQSASTSARPKLDERGEPYDEDDQENTDKETSQKAQRKFTEKNISPMSAMELEEQEMLHKRLSWEKGIILEKIQKTVSKFDEEIATLRRQKFTVEGELKVLELKLIVLQKELDLLKEFEKEDVALADKLASKRAEKAEFTSRIEEFQAKLKAKTRDMDSLTESTQTLERQLDSMTKEIPVAAAEALKKIFAKNIKRSKKKSTEDYNYNSDGEMEDESFDYDIEEEDEEAEDDSKPADCDEDLFNLVIDLREQRMAADDQKAEIKKNIDVIKKEIDTLMKKEKIASSLVAIENEIQALQQSKQEKLNEIDVVLTLKLSQFRIVNTNTIDELVVFRNEELEKLHLRIGQLQQKLANLRNKLKALHKETVNQTKDKIAKKNRNKQLDAKAVEVQMLKFGQVINIEALEKKTVNRPAEELKEKLAVEDKARNQKIEEYEWQARKVKEEYANVVRENTRLLQKLGDLTQIQNQLDNALDLSQHIVSEYSGAKKRELAEEQKWNEVAALQQQQIALLRQEIIMLRSKSRGGLYTPQGVPYDTLVSPKQ